jgi:hypothetical protein
MQPNDLQVEFFNAMLILLSPLGIKLVKRLPFLMI